YLTRFPRRREGPRVPRRGQAPAFLQKERYGRGSPSPDVCYWPDAGSGEVLPDGGFGLPNGSVEPPDFPKGSVELPAFPKIRLTKSHASERSPVTLRRVCR